MMPNKETEKTCPAGSLMEEVKEINKIGADQVEPRSTFTFGCSTLLTILCC